MRQFLRGHLATEQMKIRASMSNENKALRIQAYERLTLFCERINLMPAMLRLNDESMGKTHLKNALLIAIHKEYEHNLTQQIYVSQQLWEMVTLLKDHTIASITQVFIECEKEGKDQLEIKLAATGKTIETSLTAKVREAIRKEVELYFQ